MDDEAGTAFERAVSVARHFHEGQRDKAGRPYIEHPLAVAAFLDDDGDRIVAVLHDVLEDTDCPPGLIAEEFGAGVLDDVVALTHRAGEPRRDYLGRIAARGGRAVRVKCADIRHNTQPARLAALDRPTRDRLLAKYRESAAALGTTLEEIHAGPRR